MSPLPSIRRAESHDAAGVARLLRDTFIATYGHCSDPANVAAHVAAAFNEAKLAEEIASRDRATLVATDDAGFVVAVAQLGFASSPPSFVRPPFVELVRFYLAPAWHGSGLADALMAAAVAAAAPHGQRLWLSVWQRAPRAIAFYRRSGFAIAGPTTFVVGGDAQDDWVMVRGLP